ncbi:UDP-N-acetylmuramate dehydrogenase [Lachnospiraceae bacterium KH1T2]|nr:UDP-N-acetylmuramate dehydrogenase [Lachnospiraceae bacterium KH1T2]
MSEYFFDYIKELIPRSEILRDEPMDKHTTFRVGGPAKYFIRPADSEELEKLIKYLNLVEREYFILGNGSNLLVGDHGYDGVMIWIGKEFSDIKVDGDVIVAGAGAMLSKVASTALEHALTGLEFASGIPGSVGGAMVMNAGAYGGEMKDIVTEVNAVTPDGEFITYSNAEMAFGYRTSICRRANIVVTSAVFKLKKGDPEEIKAKMDDLKAQRLAKQPLQYPSAGSTFKRPEGYFAGKLIMDAGLSGYTIGGAKVSEKHCGFVINAGNASAADVHDVIFEVQEKVKERFGVKLEPEVCMIGEF